ncbi:leucine-rich repeat protein, partial [bacterium]|nr:leucine-rich repeat protein [bacterium]
MKKIFLAFFIISFITLIATGCFGVPTKYLNYEIPNGTTIITEKTIPKKFKKYAKNIIIPNSVTEIGEHAFDKCEDLENLTLPEGITEIKDYTFNNCLSLKNIK